MRRFLRVMSKLFGMQVGAFSQLTTFPARFLRVRAAVHGRFQVRGRDVRAHLLDAVRNTTFDRHYVYHIAWALRVLRASIGVSEHVDISSSLYFAAGASVLVPTRFYDYRPADLQLSDLTCEQADLLRLPFDSDSIISLSCMHVIEHIGLGRYGDPFDPMGDAKAMNELKRVLAPGGQLLVVVPIGGQAKIEFDAHRVYTHELLLSHFAELELVEFALIPEDARDGGLIRHADPVLTRTQHYGCGCFHFRKAHQ